MTAIRRSCFALIVLLFAPDLVRADLTAKPNAYTEKDRYRECVEFNRKSLIDTYKAIGHKNPAWDADAIKFLDDSAVHFSSVLSRAIDQPKPPDFKKLTDDGEALVKKGCDDPMVLYCYGVFLGDNQRLDESKPVLLRGYKGLLQGNYPPDRVYYAARRALKLTENIKERMDITAQMDKLRAQMLSIKFVNSAHRRLVAESLCEEIGDMPTRKQLAFYEENAKSKDTDKWIINVYGGRYFIKAAWAARGNGWANQVKPEGWQGFEASLERARECLMVAWRVAPNLPEAPTEMITVAMGSNHQGESIRTWFDRAIDAQLDYHEAYNHLRYALLPRWGGSHEEILALGIEAFRTGRYDTWVPYELIRCLESIREDRGGDMSLWDKPEIYEMVRDLMTNYAGKFKNKPETAAWYLSYAAALANRLDKHEESRKLLEQINGKPDERPYRELRLMPQLSISESYLMTTSFGKPFEAALALQRAGKHEQAAAAFQKMRDEIPKDDKGLLVVRAHVDQCQRFQKLAMGEWVDLPPGIDLLPWVATPSGAWSSPKQGELMGVADRRGMMVMSDLDMPPRYEFSAQMEIPRMGEIPNAHVGMVLNFTGWQTGHAGVWLYPGDKKLLVRGHDDKFIDVNCGSTFKLLVRVIDDEATVLLDDKEVAKFTGVGHANAKHLGIGFSGMFERPEGSVVFREMRVRKVVKEEAAKK